MGRDGTRWRRWSIRGVGSYSEAILSRRSVCPFGACANRGTKCGTKCGKKLQAHGCTRRLAMLNLALHMHTAQ
eukprot:86953-Chlamydomonas_euryale.AAC.2